MMLFYIHSNVWLQALAPPQMEFDHDEKGDALFAMDLALSLEKLNFQKLENLSEIAEKHNDPALSDFVDDLLAIQVDEVREYAIHVSKLRRVGKGLGVYEYDRMLMESAA
jgi:ferritin heavy chain